MKPLFHWPNRTLIKGYLLDCELKVNHGTQDALLLSPARAAIAEKDRRSQGSFRRSRGASPAMASPMMSDSEAGIVDGFNGNEGMAMTMTMELILDRFSKLFSTRQPS